MTDAQRLTDLLRARPGGAAWQEICTLLEACDERTLAAVTPLVLRWPAAQREMPDHWWAQWVRGDPRPCHLLAGTRNLGRLDRVETGTVATPVEEDWDEEPPAPAADRAAGRAADSAADCAPDCAPEGSPEGSPGIAPAVAAARQTSEVSAATALSPAPGAPLVPAAGVLPDALAMTDPLPAPPAAASFYQGASAVAAPPGLRWLALGARAAWQDRGGDIVRWETTRDAPLVWYLDGGECHDEAYDLQVSPDGRTVATSVHGVWRAWSAATGRPLWRLGPDRTGTGGTGPEEGSTSLDDLVRIAFSGDGRRVAFGTGSSDVVSVLDSRTGRILLALDREAEAFGPVALDRTGARLAHACPAGRVAIREVATGRLLATADTGLTALTALAMAPDGTAVFAVGGTVGGVPEAAGLLTRARPGARLLTLAAVPHRTGPDGTALLPAGPVIRPAPAPESIDAASPASAMTARAAWTPAGPHAFLAADFGSVLFDAEGRVLWADPAGAAGSFTPDGRALVVVQEEVTAWFLDGLRRPDGAPPAAGPPAPGTVLLGGLPCGLGRNDSAQPSGAGRTALNGLNGLNGPNAAAGRRPPEPPAGQPGPPPCSYWPVWPAAVTDEARRLVFSAKVDRFCGERRDVLCHWPDGEPGRTEPRITLLPGGPEAAADCALAFSPRGDAVARALSGAACQLLLHDPDTGECRWSWALPPGPAAGGPADLHLAFSGNGRRLVLASATGRVVLLDVRRGTPLHTLAEPAGPHHTALDTTGGLLAYGTAEQRVLVRATGTGQVLLDTAPARLRRITGLAFAPDARTLAVAGATRSQDAALWLLPLPPGRRPGGGAPAAGPAAEPRIAVHDFPMSDPSDGALVWSAAGPRVHFAGDRAAGVVWDAATGRVLADIPFGAQQGGVALSPDGATLVTVTQYGARRWPLP
ncbi:WD40 repeat domain-containing protein [Streptomyces aidingensis]|uniref:PQQ-like domain-containing protein n=1 Tax=Streptomyces aidingensis TaxID=910347 RepID=A0A1I1RIZ4_9ACTN|nr:WD40 repeat domain-containing protein [Streptomyces aidingensis]SFD34259.1 PQQ-like domain-containing protein [Streptomyces aidingensis]